jgi:AcrR family transcriptional regulator
VTETAPDRRGDVGEDTREAILAAAMHRFARDGYGTTSLKDIASDAGVTAGMIYHYFGSKGELYREVGVRGLQQALGTYRGVASSAHEPSQRERVQAVFEHVSANVDELEDNHWLGVTLEFDAVRYPAVAATREEWAHRMEEILHVAAHTQPDRDAAGWDWDPVLVLMLVFSFGGVCNVVRNGPEALRVATRGLQRLLAGSTT